MPGGSGSRGERALLALGWACGVAQAVLLRESMALAGGSELAWGVVLAMWLVGMSAGARVGVALGRPGAGGWGPAVMLLAGAGATVLLRAAPLLAAITPGEALASARAVWLWALAVLPVAVVGGWSFPTLTAALGDGGDAGRAWALEAAGAFVGGAVFTFALAGLGSVTALAGGLAVVVVVAPPKGSRWVAASGVAIATVLLLPWAERGLARAAWGWAGHPGELRAFANTRRQRLQLGSGPPLSVYGDGALIASAVDPYTSVPLGHLLALLHPAPRAVLCVGCLGSGVLPVLLTHPLERLLVVEDDPEMVRWLPAWLGETVSLALADARVEVRTDDPVRVIAARGAKLDLVLLLDGDPTTLRRHRTRSLEFVRACAARLAPGGVVVIRTGVSDTYLAGVGGELLATLAATLTAALPEVVGLPGEEVLLVGGPAGMGRGVTEEVLAERWQARGAVNADFDPALLADRLDEHRRQRLDAFLKRSQALPSAAGHPRAVPLAALHGERRVGYRRGGMVVTGTGMPRWPAWAGVAALASLLVSWTLLRGAPPAPLAACVGFCSMGWWVLLLAAWQAAEGSVFAEVGVLSGLFMAGLAGGAWWAARHADPGTWLAGALGVGIGVSLALASGLPFLRPRAVIIPLLLAAGACTGGAFPGLAALAGAGNERRGAGRGFAADEAGAALGAFGFGLFALPWLGVGGSGMALAGILAAALVAVLLGRRRGGA